jgi:hypothetical protein
MMILDPTYLRTIYDGLNSGALNKDNASALPMGLVGMYEAEMPLKISVNERKRFLDFFAVWALLKKEVSLEFILPLLEAWTEVQLLDYMAKYSKWFNSPVSGKFQIYHERFRTFIYQKTSNKQFTVFNDLIINQCKEAIQIKNGDEWERYALEFKTTHLLIQEIEIEDASALKSIAYNNSYWNRQIEISNGFDWSKRSLKDMLLWASKYDNNEVFECLLNQIDLYNLEQNDASRIIELVKINDIEIALQRIDAFGGNDELGLKRKFILYMLCLMELTLLDSQCKLFSKDAIFKLLKHLEENLPVDYSILDWNEFFPSYLVFLVSCELANLDLEFLFIYRRAQYWNIDWLEENGPYGETQIKVLYDSAQIIKNEIKLNTMLVSLSSIYTKQGKVEEGELILKKAIDFSNGISNNYDRNIILTAITTTLAKNGKLEDALATCHNINIEYEKNKALLPIISALAMNGEMDKSIEYANNISDYFLKSSALLSISRAFDKQGKVEESNLLINQSIECALNIINKFKKPENELVKESHISALLEISIELANQGKAELSKSLMNQSIECAYSIVDEYEKINVLIPITRELQKQGKLNESELVIKNSIYFANCNRFQYWKNKSLVFISKELARQGNLDQALKCTYNIDNNYQKITAFSSISEVLAKQNNIPVVLVVLKKSLTHINGINKFEKSKAIETFSKLMANQGNLEKAIECARNISPEHDYDNTFIHFTALLVKQGDIEKSLEYANDISDEYLKSRLLNSISNELVKQGYIDKAIECVKSISSNIDKDEALGNISSELAIQGNIEDAIIHSNNIRNKSNRFKIFKFIIFELIKKDKIEEAMIIALANFDEFEKIQALASMSSEILKNGNVDLSNSILKKALEYARDTETKNSLSSKYNVSDSLKFISSELVNQDKNEEAMLVLEQAYEYAIEINDEFEKNNILDSIYIEFAKQGNLQKALDCINNIHDEDARVSSLFSLTIELAKQGNLENAINLANSIGDEFWKSEAFYNIIEELSKKGEIEKAIQCAYGINKKYLRSSSLLTICTDLAKQDKLKHAEQIGSDISEIAERHSCWKTIASNNLEVLGCEKALLQSTQFQIPEAKLFYLKGLANSIDLMDCKPSFILGARNFYEEDIESFEMLLQKYALRELFIEDAIPEKIDRFNKSLNIQWAIDLKKIINYE